MTLEELKETRWWARFNRGELTSHEKQDAIRMVLRNDTKYEVYPVRRNYGQRRYAIVASNPSRRLCLDEFSSRKAALAMCKEMGWEVSQ